MNSHALQTVHVIAAQGQTPTAWWAGTHFITPITTHPPTLPNPLTHQIVTFFPTASSPAIHLPTLALLSHLPLHWASAQCCTALEDPGSQQTIFRGATKWYEWEQGGGQNSQAHLERLKGGFGERRYWGRMTHSLFLESSRNINSPGGRKSGANTLAINHSMLISGESHLMLLEMNW